MQNLFEILKRLSQFISHWEQQTEEDQISEYLMWYEYLSYYLRAMRDVLKEPMDIITSLQDGFWWTSWIDWTIEDKFTESDDFREDYNETDHFVGQRHHFLLSSFWVACVVYEGCFLAIKLFDGFDHPIWIVKILSDPSPTVERWNLILIRYLKLTSQNERVQRFYEGWDSLDSLHWKVEEEYGKLWESTTSILTSWKFRAKRSTRQISYYNSSGTSPNYLSKFGRW